MDLKCILTLSCLSVARNSAAQDAFNVGVVNPDVIYFNDGGQRIPANAVPVNNKRANWPNQDANWQNAEPNWQNRGNVNPTQAQPVVPNQDPSYLQGIQGNVNYGQTPSAASLNRDANYMQGNQGNVNYGQTPSAVSLNRDANYMQGNQGNVNNGQAQSVVPLNGNPNSLQGNQVNLGQTQSSAQAVQPVDRFGNTIINQNSNLNNNLNQVQTTIPPEYYGKPSVNAGNNFRPAVSNTTAPVGRFALALTEFSIRFMKNVPGQQGNLVVSPFSVATLLALLQQGSKGTTLQQITNALQLTSSEATTGFKGLIDNINKRYSSNILKVANSLFIADGFEINSVYKSTAKNDFGSDVTPMKFNRPKVAAQKINYWVAMNTNDKIKELISPADLSADTQLVLVNAVYFKGLWAVKFKPEATISKEFNLSNGGKKPTDFMRMRRNFKTGHDKTTSSQILILPFEKELYSLVLILPAAASTVTSVLNGLTKEHLIAYHNMAVKEVAIELPKFTVKTDTNLAPVLNNLGVINMFGSLSDLSAIGAYQGHYTPQVSSALHSALLSIDEQGGVAAAASSFAAVALSYDDPSVVFNANRPFLAILWDNTASIPLFMARIEDPVS